MPSPEMSKYWIPHVDIHKRVITQEIQCYLGPQATVRPLTRDVGDSSPVPSFPTWSAYTGFRQGEDGFLITTPGPCLTDVSPAMPASYIDLVQHD